MSDIFDELDPKKKKKDIFDEAADSGSVATSDVFDEVQPEEQPQDAAQGDVFDEADAELKKTPNGQTIYPQTTVGKEIVKGLPGLAADTLKEAGKDTAAAAAYEAAGAVKGASLGYVDPSKLIDKTPLGDANINKNIAKGAGEFIGAVAPISKISQGVGLGLEATGLLRGVRPVLQGLVQAGLTGAAYGASRNPEEAKQGQVAARAHNALNDAATFIVLTGTGQIFDKAAQALGLGKTNAYNSLREDIIQKFTAKGATPEQAAEMADVGLKTAVEKGGGWSDVTAKDLRSARRAVRNGEKIVIGENQVEPPPQAAGPAVGGPQPPEPPATGPTALLEKTPPQGEAGKVPPVAGQPLEGPTAGAVAEQNVPRGNVPQEPSGSDVAPIPRTKIDARTVSPKGIEYIKQKFPALAEKIVGQDVPLTEEQTHEVLIKSTAAGEEVLLKGGTPEQAQMAALQAFADHAKALTIRNVPKVSQPPANGTQVSQPTDIFDEAATDLEAKTPARPSPGLADVVKSLGVQPHELSGQQYAEAFGQNREPQLVQGEHRQLVKEALKSGQPVPEDVQGEYPDLHNEVNKEAAKEAAQHVLTANKIDDQAVVKIVDHIVADEGAFKKNYNREFQPGKTVIRGSTQTPIDTVSGERLQTVINLANGATRATGRHEAFHAVSNILLDDAERQIIEDAFQPSEADKRDAMEQAADAFAQYQAGRAPKDGVVKRVFDKIKQFLARLKNYMKVRKFQTAEDIFDAVDSGKMGERAQPAQRPSATVEPNRFQAAKITETPEFKNWFGDSKVVSPDGQPLVVYRGDFRADLVGTRLKKGKASSGRFYFTADPEIASGYATGKHYTESESYSDWYQVRVGNRKYNIDQAWWHLTPEQREGVKKMMMTTETDEQGDFIDVEPMIYNGEWHFQYMVREAKGNWLKAAVDKWLDSAALYNEEERFGDLLKKAGIDDFEYIDQQKGRPGVTAAYLSIKNPLDASKPPEEFLDAVDRWAQRSRYQPKEHGMDPWDKTTRAPKNYAATLRENAAKGESLWTTSIPDPVVKIAQRLGYDGIRDTGGKYGGKENEQWIAFEPQQVKSAIGNRGTFNPNSPDIRYKAAFHGSPHEFDQFSTERIGSGEGNQAYGWGLYFAGKEDVAAHYRQKLTQGKKGSMYKVDIPDDSELLDLDKLIADQPKIEKVAKKLGIELDPYVDVGENFLVRLEDKIKETEGVSTEEARRLASLKLKDMGVPGSRYFDELSRGDEANPTHNYVIFDDSRVKMLERYSAEDEAPGAKFIGYQDMGDGTHEPLYNITGAHPRVGSTVSAQTLNEEKIPVPKTPSVDEWKSSQVKNKEIAARQPVPTFYSELAKTVTKKMQGKASVDQVKAMLKNSQNIRKEELEWSGINEWLDQQKGSITKDQVQSFIEMNGLKLNEQVRGGNLDITPDDITISEPSPSVDAERREFPGMNRVTVTFGDKLSKRFWISEERNGIVEVKDSGGYVIWHSQVEGVKGALAEWYRQNRGIKPKWAGYTLNGPKGTAFGEDPASNYREFVVTIPNFGWKERSDFAKYYEAMQSKYGRKPQTGQELATADAFQNFDQLRGALHSKYGPVDKILEDLTPEEKADYDRLQTAASKNFSSGHWDNDNVVLHVRSTDRKTPDGKKVLFIEEVQSDWHEHGRAKGYIEPNTEERIAELKNELKKVLEEAKPYADQGKDSPRELIERHSTITDEINALSDKMRDGIPNAPFKNTWHELAMKMAMRRAAEEGYDFVAWTTAQMQKDRWRDQQVFDLVYDKAIPKFMDGVAKKLGSGLGELELDGVAPKRKIESSRRRATPDVDLNRQYFVYDPSDDVVATFDDEDEANDWMTEKAESQWSVSERTEYYITDPNGEQVGDYHESESDAEEQMREKARENSGLRVHQTEKGWEVQEPAPSEFELRDLQGFARVTTDTRDKATEAYHHLVEAEPSLRKLMQIFEVHHWDTVETFEDEDAANEYVDEQALADWTVETNTQWEVYDGNNDSEYFDSEEAAQRYMNDHALEGWAVRENEEYDPDAVEQPPEDRAPKQVEDKSKDRVKVPAVPITDQMKESLLYTGQPLYKAEDFRRDVDKALIPSRRPEKRAYTERMALRRSLQRQSLAAARGAQAQADRILGVQTIISEAIKKLIPEANRGTYLEDVLDIQTLDDADKFISRLEREGSQLTKKADKSMLKEELDKRRASMKADKQERANLRRLFEREAAVARQAAVSTNRELTDLKKGIVDTIEAQLPKDERGQFLKMIASASNWKDVIKAVNRIDLAVEKSARKMMVNSLKREFQRVQASKAIAVDYRWRVRDLLQNVIFKQPSTLTMGKLNALQKFIDSQRALGQDVNVPQYLADRMKVLAAVPVDKIHATVLEDVLGQIRTLADLGRTKLAKIKELDGLRKERDLRDLVASSVPLNNKALEQAAPGEDLKMGSSVKNLLSTAYNTAQRVNYALMPVDVLFDTLDGLQGFSGPNYRVFKARVDADFGRYLDASSAMKKEVGDKVKALGLKRANFERIGVYAIAAQEGGVDKLKNNGLTPEQVKRIVLTPKERELYTFMRRKLDEMRPRIADTMKTVYNADLGEVKNYFPFVTDYELMDETQIEQKMLNDITGRRKNVEAGYTKERVGAGAQRVNVDALDVYLKHIDDVSYLVNMGPTTKYLGELANKKEYEAMVGNVGARLVRDWIDTLARKGGVVGGQQIAILDKLRSNIGAATLAFKLSSTLVQTTPLIEGAAMVGNYAFRGAAHFSLSPAWRRFVLQNFPEIRERGGDDPALMEFSKGGGVREGLNKLKDAGFWSLKKLDEWAAAGVATGAYQKWLADNGKPALNPHGDTVVSYPEGIAYAQRVVRRTQASPFFKDVPMAITRGSLTGNRSFDRAILQFQNFVLNQFSLLTHEGMRYALPSIPLPPQRPQLGGPMPPPSSTPRRPAEPGVAIQVWAYSILAILATGGIRLGLDEMKASLLDEKHRKKKDQVDELISQSVQELVSRIPFVSQIMSFVKWGSMPSPALDVVKRLGEGASGLYGYYNKDNTKLYHNKKQRKKAVTKTVTAAGQVIGVPGAVELGDAVRRAQK